MSLKSYHWLQHAAGGSLAPRSNNGALEMRQMLVGAALACDAVGAAADSYRETVVPAEAREVVAFWEGAGPAMWFAKDDEFDRRFRERFLALHESAARGDLDGWNAAPEGALALLILLDQFPRNAFRGTPRMYATDPAALKLADAAIAAGHDRFVAADLQAFFYLPFGHSEELADQERAVELCARLGGRNFEQAQHHRDIVRRFGRFPHRNAILGRPTTQEEADYLAGGGYMG
jgi:uncharacterized protein (DUF924 family)